MDRNDSELIGMDRNGRMMMRRKRTTMTMTMMTPFSQGGAMSLAALLSLGRKEEPKSG